MAFIECNKKKYKRSAVLSKYRWSNKIFFVKKRVFVKIQIQESPVFISGTRMMKRSTSPTKAVSVKRKTNWCLPSDQTITRLCAGVRLPTGWLPNLSQPRSNSQYSVSTCLFVCLSVCLCTGVRLPTGWLPNLSQPKSNSQYSVSTCLFVCLSVCLCTGVRLSIGWLPNLSQPRSNSQYSVSTVCLSVYRCEASNRVTPKLLTTQVKLTVQCKYCLSVCLSVCLKVWFLLSYVTCAQA